MTVQRSGAGPPVHCDAAQRGREPAAARPQFRRATIFVRDEVSKTRQSRTIPMAARLAPMLRERVRGVARDGYIFGDGTDFERPFWASASGSRRWWRRCRKSEPWTLHDIRRTVATRLHETGTDALVVEDLLGHLTGVRSGVAGVYNRASTLDRQRQAIEAWSARLTTLATPTPAGPAVAAEVGPATANVVRLKRKVT